MQTKRGFSLIETAIAVVIIMLCAMVIIQLRSTSDHLSAISLKQSSLISKMTLLLPYSKAIDSSNVIMKDVLTANHNVPDENIRLFFDADKCGIKNEDSNISINNQQNMPIAKIRNTLISIDDREIKLHRLTAIKK